MADRHFEHPLAEEEKRSQDHRQLGDRIYLRELVLAKRDTLEDFLRGPPRTDSFGNRYGATREEAIRCFLNNFAVDRMMEISLQECIKEINLALGWDGVIENSQYFGENIAGNEVAGESGFLNWLKRIFS